MNRLTSKYLTVNIDLNMSLRLASVELAFENTLPTLLRLQSLASGFKTFALRQKTELFRLPTVFKGQFDTGLVNYLG